MLRQYVAKPLGFSEIVFFIFLITNRKIFLQLLHAESYRSPFGQSSL